MRPSIEYLTNKFNEYNNLMFSGKLPLIPILLSDVSSFVGKCECKIKRTSNGNKVHEDFRIKINSRVDYHESVIEDTLIHEMIHYFILYNNLIDTSAHGAIFKSIMNSINTNYGRHISVSHKPTTSENLQRINTAKKWHVIAVVNMASSKCGVKVLPRVVDRILDYYNKIINLSDVKSIDLYLHNDPYFNKYPTSAAYKIYEINRQDLQSHLSGAHRLRPAGNKLIQE